MAQRVEALINPEVLLWARQTAGLSIEGAAKKLAIQPDRLASWEAGDARPSISQLRNISNVYKRPLAAFYLPEAPRTFKIPLTDYRRLPGDQQKEYTPELTFELRRAEYRRQIVLDLHEDLGEPIPQFDHTIALGDDVETIAQQIRDWLGIKYEQQVEWKTDYESLNNWRTAIEAFGILVFQFPNVDMEEARGFSIGARPFPVIAVNTKDSPNGRIFSIAHELTHILLKNGGLCNLEDDGQDLSDVEKTEVFCNRVAGAVLVPEQYLVNEDIVRYKRPRTEWNEVEIGSLAQRYGVSRETVLRRLLITGFISEAFYLQKRQEFIKAYAAKEKKTSGGPPIEKKVVSNSGRFYVNLVLTGYYQDKISSSDLANYLGVQIKHLSNIEMELASKAA